MGLYWFTKWDAIFYKRIVLQIRKYHHEFYRPENLNIIITGQVEPEEVFSALEGIEQKILRKVSLLTSEWWMIGKRIIFFSVLFIEKFAFLKFYLLTVNILVNYFLTENFVSISQSSNICIMKLMP